ncbi:MAG: mannose-6-phosphate isomerase, class I [Wenzhouxiangellaceae bacterium]|nr:mannose-6-phosphate isomerase, class I [Wenzhouxiangellaceae bacterium]
MSERHGNPDTPLNLPHRALPPILPLSGRIRHYHWGGTRFIPELLGIANPDGRRHAEYWLGAHPQAPSTVRFGRRKVDVDALIEHDPDRLLGPTVAARFGELPFLFKILDVERPLSIQIHPDRAQAEAGFARENSAGIPLDAPHRTFRDPNPKPEFLLALDDFRLLYGIRPESELASTVAETPGVSDGLPALRAEGPAGLVHWILHLPADRLERAVDRLGAHVAALPTRQRRDRDQPWAWIRDWLARHRSAPARLHDRGLLFLPLMHLIRLHAGQGVLVGAGRPHAYLSGAGLEIMTNSDNVIRAGLTGKHTDPELLSTHVDLSPAPPRVMAPTSRGGCRIYTPSRPEFDLRILEAGPGSPVEPATDHGPAIALVLEGEAELAGKLRLETGQSALVLPGQRCRIEAPCPARLAWATAGHG